VVAISFIVIAFKPVPPWRKRIVMYITDYFKKLGLFRSSFLGNRPFHCMGKRIGINQVLITGDRIYSGVLKHRSAC